MLWSIYLIVTARHGSTPRQTHDDAVVWRRVSCDVRRFRMLRQRRSDVLTSGTRSRSSRRRIWYVRTRKTSTGWMRSPPAQAISGDCGGHVLHGALGETFAGETGDHTADECATFSTDYWSHQCERLLLRRRYDVPTWQRSQNGRR